MTEAIRSLTEKEKAVLRLLLTGHDAKSMASQLGLSVHTVNGRLRDARRKLGVSSSKAAARILREAEGEAPQNLGDKALGGAPAAPAGHADDPVPMRRPRARPGVWTLGGFAMLALFIAALAVSAPETMPVPSQPASQTATIAESDASRAARSWLTLVDVRNWADSWAATGASFRKANTVVNWQAAAEQVHANLGPALSRALLADVATPTPPDGARTVRFRASFADNRSAIETLSLKREDGRWRVVGIYVD
jgi:DNA-binding CsgD family transcriptional regulator